MENKKPLEGNSEIIIKREHELHDIARVQRNNSNGDQLSETEKTVLHTALISGEGGCR